MTGAGPEAGWYDDPDDASRYRYWDGARWTDHRSPKRVAPVRPGPFEESHAGWALGLSIAGVLCCLPLSIAGVIQGTRELRRVNDGLINPDQRGVAIAALVIGGLGTLVGLLVFVPLLIDMGA
ncbi:MAG: DUF2510 domain-containing protein [Actinomycetota bacterium]